MLNILNNIIQVETMSLNVSDAVDYKGISADKSKTAGWVPAALILGLYMCLAEFHKLPGSQKLKSNLNSRMLIYSTCQSYPTS